ncbi:MAG: hypothetical protein MPN21_23975 [Thermoanaerobaculia bacterium]|nr:hypothetical protein [Thermoanaerobaculia bacterium]
MIHVSRESIPKPEFWDSSEFRSFLDEWCRFHGEQGGARHTQRRAPFATDLDEFKRLALFPLLEAFHGKCAYSEQKIDDKTAVVVFHRPEADATDEKGDVSPLHYWWSVSDWSNWYPAHREVQVAKGTSFPVAGERSPVPSGSGVPPHEWIESNRDDGLLLEPRRDRPAFHLEFLDDGSVNPRRHPAVASSTSGDRRGATTIKLLDLNQSDLVSRRAWAMELESRRLRTLVPYLDRGGSPKALGVGVVPADVAFAAALRQQVARSVLSLVDRFALGDSSPDELALVVANVAEELAAEIAMGNGADGTWWTKREGWLEIWEPVRDVLHEELPDQTDAQLWQMIRTGRELGPLSVAVEESAGAEPPEPPDPAASHAAAVSKAVPPVQMSRMTIDRSARVTGVTIRNFKAIEDLELDLRTTGVEILPRYGYPDVYQTGVDWTVFLGENGSGKSCYLQAIAVALAGDRLDDLIASTGLEWRLLLRRGQKQGRVCLRFTGGASVDLRFNERRHWWVGGLPQMQGFVRGYGATRLLEGELAPADDDAKVRLANLFDAKAPVLDAERWLSGIVDDGDFNAAAVTLAGFLGAEEPRVGDADPLPEERFFTRDGQRNEVLAGGDPLSYASDGYRAVVALVCDIMAGLAVGFSDLRNATGIVMIDEIGAHLHPRWKMEITSRLRAS